MTAYVLINDVNTAFFAPQTVVPPTTDGPIPQITIALEQSFQLSVRGQIGQQMSATVQVWVSNDDGGTKHWAPYFDPVTITGLPGSSAGFGGSQNWKYYSATLVAISGLHAHATLIMNG